MNELASVKFDIQIAHSIQEIGPEPWDRLSGDRPFNSYRWYRFGETVLTNEPPVYVVLSLGGEPVAGAALRFVQHEQAIVQSGPLRALVLAMLRRWPLLLCESPFGARSSLFLPDPPLRDAALRTITQVVRDQAQQQRASFLGFPYLEEHEVGYAGWTDDFASVELANPVTHLHIAWSDFDSYLSTLSRKRRKHYRRHLRYAERMGIEVTLHPKVIDVDGAMALIRNVWEKYHESPDPGVRRSLENANMVDAAWVAARIGDRLVGCELVVGDRGCWRVMALGRDYGYQDVYFLLGYADIRYAIEHGARTLYWGALAYEAKRRLGFQLGTNRHVMFAGNGPLFHRFGYWVARRESRQDMDRQEDDTLDDD